MAAGAVSVVAILRFLVGGDCGVVAINFVKLF